MFWLHVAKVKANNSCWRITTKVYIASIQTASSSCQCARMSALMPLLLLLHVLNACYCQTTGDLRLAHQHHDSYYDVAIIVGRLEIFWNGKWGTFL